MRLPLIRLAGAAICTILAGSLPARENPPGRLTGTFEGIEFEYSPGQDELARLLATRFAAGNRDLARSLPAKKSELVASTVPLSPGEMKLNRAMYLGRIASFLSLERVTPLQEECYDAFLDNYELNVALYEHLGDLYVEFLTIKRVTIWSRDELARRFEAGESITGFSYNPATKQGDATFGFNANHLEERFADLAAKREKLHRDYQMSVTQENGQSVYRGRVSPIPAAASVTDNGPSTSAAPAGLSDQFPVVIPVELNDTPPAELAQKLWDGSGDRSIARMLGQMAGLKGSLPRTDPHLGFILLHETTEVGIIDRYWHGPDRRWFCDGVANYVPWRVVRDLHGPAVAASVYNLPDELARYAPLREKADLRHWPATENQSEADQHTDLDSARYAFAANAVFLMNARAGEDVLPKLFAEIGKTKPDKVSIKTVEKAWSKVTGTKLDPILAAAVQTPASETTSAGRK